MRDSFKLFMNRDFVREAPYDDAARSVINLRDHAAAMGEISSWPSYAPTPLHDLSGLAAHFGVEAIYYKDEASRFGLGSFKVVGGAYGVLQALRAHLRRSDAAEPGGRELWSGAQRERLAGITVTCATDGNHGRAVAWAAQQFGCDCVVYVPSIVSPARRRAISAHGARVVAVDGTYDEALREADTQARVHGRIVVSDQSYAGYESIPRDIMQGYTIVAAEVLAQLAGRPAPTHVLVQAGVGGFAAAVCGHLWETLGAARPDFLCIEPLNADCLLRSARAGGCATVPGDLDTVMACLSCGEPSTLAWRVLERGASAFVAVSDDHAIESMRLLAGGTAGDPRVVAGESGAAGVAGLRALTAVERRRLKVGMGAGARVLVFGTEGATDPEIYASIVGSLPDSAERETRG